MNRIHPSALIEGDVRLGTGNEIGAFCVLNGPLVIGDNNAIGPHTVIGTPGQDTRNPRYDSSSSPIVIGDDNIIREFVAIQKPAYGHETRLGSRLYLMQGVHIPHDALVEDDVVVTPMVAMGGMAKILQGANIGMGATIHQYGVVGQYSIVATGAAATKNVRPFTRYIPGQAVSANAYAIEKFGFSAVREEIDAYVFNGAMPSDSQLITIVQHYESFHERSSRRQYD